jgi:hypothetical protein
MFGLKTKEVWCTERSAITVALFDGRFFGINELHMLPRQKIMGNVLRSEKVPFQESEFTDSLVLLL